jgi:hypothetical protein
MFSNYRSPILTIIVLSLSASKPVLGLISAEEVLYLGSPIVIITSSLVSSILSAFIGLNIVITSLKRSSF